MSTGKSVGLVLGTAYSHGTDSCNTWVQRESGTAMFSTLLSKCGVVNLIYNRVYNSCLVLRFNFFMQHLHTTHDFDSSPLMLASARLKESVLLEPGAPTMMRGILVQQHAMMQNMFSSSA